LLGGAAAVFGIAAIYSVLYPGPSGEWAVLVVLAAYVVNVTIGLMNLVVGLFVKRGEARLRGPCVVLSVTVLSLPVLANLMFWWHGQRTW
jgi:hypothetical protein